ncbi:unnamed protein product [Clonostachys rosea]|uniref:Tho complex subunit 7/Mft1p n=1 Tax=Bionectria ochroleuca TaxID=29856 RepID=A0ABY6UD39_BIOOC|nr:unnamed protein product [Clonostachys rosea]
MADWGLLDEKAEAELHKARLLNIEEKPFKRCVRRLATITDVVSSSIPLKNIEPTPDANGKPSTKPDIQLLKEGITIDFASFDSSLLRFQFLHDANARERERYKADQERILLECQAVREKNTELRVELEGARATLAQRRKFDVMADKITSNRLLRPREDQLANLAKLEEECKELERESETYSATWTERRAQFNRIIEEGMLLRRQIRDEKEEVDRREGMNEGGDDEVSGQTPRPDRSRSPSPSGEGAEQAKSNAEGETPQPPGSNVGTPLRDSPAPSHLHPGAGSRRSLSQAGSRDVTPLPLEEGEDEEMEDQDQKDSREVTEVETPRIHIEAAGDKMDVDN